MSLDHPGAALYIAHFFLCQVAVSLGRKADCVTTWEACHCHFYELVLQLSLSELSLFHRGKDGLKVGERAFWNLLGLVGLGLGWEWSGGCSG